jgi:hypothetical protein
VASNFEKKNNNNNIAHFMGNVIALIRTDTHPKAEMTKLMSAEVFRGYEKLINFVKKKPIFSFFPPVPLVFISTKALRLCYQAQSVWVFIKVYKKNHISHPVVTFFFFFSFSV